MTKYGTIVANAEIKRRKTEPRSHVLPQLAEMDIATALIIPDVDFSSREYKRLTSAAYNYGRAANKKFTTSISVDERSLIIVRKK